MYNNYPYYGQMPVQNLQESCPICQQEGQKDERFVGFLGPALLGGLAGGLAGGYLAGPRYPAMPYPYPAMPYPYPYGCGYGCSQYYRPY